MTVTSAAIISKYKCVCVCVSQLNKADITVYFNILKKISNVRITQHFGASAQKLL